MAISIAWATKVITVPKADTTLVQATPTEIRELNLNDFRLALKGLEASENGLIFPDTHIHNTEVTLGGIIYARVIEIINGYTVTFEDGQYAVNLVGANSNVGDVVNVNQVSVRSANSAGLTSSTAVEAASFFGGVAIDIGNGVVGTQYPTGTRIRPAGNLADALLIAQFRGLHQIFVTSTCTFSGNDFSDGYVFIGDSRVTITLTLDPGIDITNCEFRNMTVQGTIDGGNVLSGCDLGAINFFSGLIYNCGIGTGKITLGGNVLAQIINSYSTIAGGALTTEIDMGGIGQELIVRGWSGGIKISNRTGTDSASIDIRSGQIIIDSTVVAGTIVLRGSGVSLTDNSTGVAVIDTSGLSFPEMEQLAAFGGQVHIDTSSSNAGTKFPNGTEQFPLNNLADAKAVAETRKIVRFFVKGSLTVGATDNIDDFELIGAGATSTTITCAGGCSTLNTKFTNLALTGDISGAIIVRECAVWQLTEVGATMPTFFFQTQLSRVDNMPSMTMRNDLPSQGQVVILSCFSGGIGKVPTVIDMNGSDIIPQLMAWSGPVEFENWSGGQFGSVDLVSGYVEAGASCTDGKLTVHGAAEISDNSTGTFVFDADSVIVTSGIEKKVDEMHAIHGLVDGAPVSVTQTARTAGAISQTIAASEALTIITRDP